MSLYTWCLHTFMGQNARVLLSLVILAKSSYSMQEPELGGRKIMSIIQWNQSYGVEHIQKLIDAGADVNYAVPDSGLTALILVMGFGRPEIVKLLLKAGAHVNTQNYTGETALYRVMSTTNGSPEITKMLLEHGADVTLGDKYGGSVLWHALCHNYDTTAQLLLDYGFDINARNSSGQTTLIHLLQFIPAPRYRLDKALMFLLKRHADTSIIDHSGNNAFTLIQRQYIQLHRPMDKQQAHQALILLHRYITRKRKALIVYLKHGQYSCILVLDMRHSIADLVYGPAPKLRLSEAKPLPLES